jgi:hypothetical protein
MQQGIFQGNDVQEGEIMPTPEEYSEEEIKYSYNEGRLSADKKWIEAIDERIAELEKQVGIPELRRLRERVRYRWDNYNDTEKEKPKKIAFVRSKGVRRRPSKGVKEGRPYLMTPSHKKKTEVE